MDLVRRLTGGCVELCEHPGTEADPPLVLDEPVLQRGPGSCGNIIGDTRDDTRLIPF